MAGGTLTVYRVVCVCVPRVGDVDRARGGACKRILKEFSIGWVMNRPFPRMIMPKKSLGEAPRLKEAEGWADGWIPHVKFACGLSLS